MEDVLVDYHLALAIAEVQVGDLQSNRYILTQSALRKHGVTEEELDSSMLYWCRNSEKFVKICDRVSERLNYMAESQGVERQERNPYSYLATEGDTANVWNLREGVVVVPNIVDNIYSFTIEADTTYHPGDNFMWAFTTQFLNSDHYNEAYALLSIHYDNDSIVGTSQRISSSRQIEVRLNCPIKYKNVPIRSVNGTIYMPLRKEGFGILALNNFVLVRYHDKTIKIDKEETLVADSTEKLVNHQLSDTIRVRQNPYDIRNEQADERTINIVRDKPLKVNRRR
ncbi:MAG: DUF4296 domain-containing protein [Bacteroidaceae bacterium]|nr:DUF4296 domain-containing protein [Bacteroidaceae bacterium]